MLPFRVLSKKDVDRYLAEGMVHDVVASLAGLQELFVIASHTAFIYKAKSVDVQTIGRGVHPGLSGSWS